MKIIEVTNVDFSLRHFLLPLMRAIRARGHEVIGACAEGPLLGGVREEGFRVVALPLERTMSPAAHLRAFRAMIAL
ncbi:MAG: glycosyltransferase family 1 protein, partial [Acetobacteraceae bacterium]